MLQPTRQLDQDSSESLSTLPLTVAGERAATALADWLGPGPTSTVLSPYRICPLGAHVDHQDGVVTGMAIDRGVVVAFRRREDTLVQARSADYPGEVRFDLQAVPPAASGDWGNYLRGAAVVLNRRTGLHYGADLYVLGQLPAGGLSSSAAVSVGYLLALEMANELQVTTDENVALMRAIENEYVGLRSGILDQSMILLSRQDHLLRLDCRTGERGHIAFGHHAARPGRAHADRVSVETHSDSVGSPGAAPVAIAVAYSGLAHALVGTGYNQRVAECQEAARLLLQAAGQRPTDALPRLRDVPVEVFEQLGASLPEHLRRRAAHYFGEQRRVAAGTTAWAQGDLARFGQLVTESGLSSIENYECGAPELIALYTILRDTAGVVGTRFSGAGFRGACLALVEPDSFERVAERVRAAYLAAYPQYEQTFGIYRCASGAPARVVEAPAC